MLWEIVNLQNVGKAENTRVVNRRHRGSVGDDPESKSSAKSVGSSGWVGQNSPEDKSASSSETALQPENLANMAQYHQSLLAGQTIQRRPNYDGEPTLTANGENDQESAGLLERGGDGNSMPTKYRKEGMYKIESLDYEIIENSVYKEDQANRTVSDIQKYTALRWIFSVAIGVMVGLTAFAINIAVENVAGIKFGWTFSLMEYSYFASFLVYTLFNIALVLSSSVLIVYFAPAAAGSGIPDVKGYLNGVDYPGILLFRTLVGKVLGSIGSVAGGLAVGKEGPLVHTGACIASLLGQGGSSRYKMNTRALQVFKNNRDRRDLVTCGAAAGVAAAFRAPVGGVLFALEEATSWWRPQLTWRTFFTCAVVVVTLKAAMTLCDDGACGHFGSGGFIIFEIQEGQEDFLVSELIPMAMLGVLGGMLGALFNHLNLRISLWRKQRSMSKRSRIVEACVVAFATSVASFCLPLLSSCSPCPNEPDIACPREDIHSGNFVSFNCPGPDQYNGLATIFFNTQDDAVRNLFSSNTKHEYSSGALLTYLVVFFILAVVTYGISVPSGLFVPCILIGATYGRLVGILMVQMYGKDLVDEGTYALLGAASFLAGSMRMTVSLCVILLELTNNLKLLPLIMLVLLIAKAVGDGFNKAVYDIHVDLKEMPFLEEAPERFFRHLSAEDACVKSVVHFSRFEKVANIMRILEESDHNGFPVFEVESENSQQLLGIILRSHLLVILRSKSDFQTLEDAKSAGLDSDTGVRRNHKLKMTDFSKDVSVHGDTVKDVHLTTVEREMFIDLKPYCNPSPYVVSPEMSLTKVYTLFRQMGLRHLCVVPKPSEVMGMITRKDLLPEVLEGRIPEVGSPLKAKRRNKLRARAPRRPGRAVHVEM